MASQPLSIAQVMPQGTTNYFNPNANYYYSQQQLSLPKVNQLNGFSVINALGKAAGAIGQGIANLGASVIRAEAKPPTAPASQGLNVRGLSVNPADITNEFAPVLFGEVSNRTADKKELEARVILNTALNRMEAYAKRGTPKTLAEVLSMENQYQAYGGEQYNLYKAGTSTTLDTAKKQEVDQIIQKLIQEGKAGAFADNTEGSYYYVHNPDGSIKYDNKRPLFK